MNYFSSIYEKILMMMMIYMRCNFFFRWKYFCFTEKEKSFFSTVIYTISLRICIMCVCIIHIEWFIIWSFTFVCYHEKIFFFFQSFKFIDCFCMCCVTINTGCFHLLVLFCVCVILSEIFVNYKLSYVCLFVWFEFLFMFLLIFYISFFMFVCVCVCHI